MKRVLILTIAMVVLGGCSIGPNRLFDAVMTGNVKTVRSYIKKGGDINITDKDGWTPLHVAADYGKIGVVKLLLSHGADVNAKDRWGRSPLHWASRAEDDIVIPYLLISHGADVNAKDKKGWTPLHWASWADNDLVAYFLISQGADVNAKDKDGKTPLHLAAERGLSFTVYTLLKGGADPTIKDNYGKTPLDYAYSEYERVLRDLRNFEIRKFGKSDSEIVEEIYKKLKKREMIKRDDISPEEAISMYKSELDRMRKIGEKYLSIIENLLNAEAEVFVNAIRSQDWEKVNKIIENAPLDELKVDYLKALRRLTPILFLAAAGGFSKEVETFLRWDLISVNSKDSDGQTLLHWVALGVGDTVTAKVLLSYGADVNARDKDGNTPLHLAMIKGWSKEIVKFLISHGADVNAKNNKRKTPLDMAVENGHEEIADILRAAGARE